jgi:hypothetical protein
MMGRIRSCSYRIRFGTSLDAMSLQDGGCRLACKNLC